MKILGIGAEGSSLQWLTARRIVVAWVGTLPVGAALASWLA